MINQNKKVIIDKNQVFKTINNTIILTNLLKLFFFVFTIFFDISFLLSLFPIFQNLEILILCLIFAKYDRTNNILVHKRNLKLLIAIIVAIMVIFLYLILPLFGKDFDNHIIIGFITSINLITSFNLVIYLQIIKSLQNGYRITELKKPMLIGVSIYIITGFLLSITFIPLSYFTVEGFGSEQKFIFLLIVTYLFMFLAYIILIVGVIFVLVSSLVLSKK